MAGPPELDDTQRSFPAYADLTQTQGWAKRDPRIKADTNEAAEAVEVSQRSRYTEGAVLGTGGMGKVVLARDARIGREVAVKVLHADRELDPEDRARFLREAQVQGQLEHPSIVPVYDIERRPDGSTFFTMRRVLGRTLAAILDDLRKGVPAAKARYTQRELLNAFATVCLAVDYAHTRGVVHRDLKPANIMLGDFGEVYVLDWGLARLVDEAGATVEEPHARLSLPGTFLGTPLYMAPEQMADPAVGPDADVYSLGLILFELLTLERARDPNAVFAPVDARPSARTPYRNIAPELEMICVKAVEPDPADRYPSARAMQEAINRYLEGDREIEQRRQLASQHMTTARLALGTATGRTGPDAEKERGVAMSELARAVALDPTNGENVSMLADIMANPPGDVPAAVEAHFEEEARRIMKIGAAQGLISMGLWVLTLPFFLSVGFAHPWQAALIAAPVAVMSVLAYAMMRGYSKSWIQYVSVAVLNCCAMMVARVYGPFVLVPTILATNAIVLQTHPRRKLRRFSAGCGIAFMVMAIAIEWTGVLPSSYVFEGGVWTIVPQMVQLPHHGSFLFMTVVSVAMILVPAAFIARLRGDLTHAQVKLAVQAWHFRRLGAQLIGERV
jgi:eukaryotic-like serine/threonine-protein kinase